MGERYLKSVRLLAECLQGFERFVAEPVRRHGLTHPQFDIIATLGNTPGMTYKELGERTLITKGTLTGVIDRLEQKGLVERVRKCDDKRSFLVRLTAAGDTLFHTVFPAVVAHGKLLFADYGDGDFEQLDHALHRLRTRLDAPDLAAAVPGELRAGTSPPTKDDMKTALLEGKKPPHFDKHIIGNLLLDVAPPAEVRDEPMVIGVRNDAGEIYRVIGAATLNSFMNAVEELFDLGLIDELQDKEEQKDGCDAIFSEP